MLYVTLASISFLLCQLIVSKRQYLRRYIESRNDAIAVQSAHSGFVPRIGGLAIFLTFLSMYPFAQYFGIETNGGKFFLSLLPIVIVGLSEDLGFAISPRNRMLGIVCSGGLTAYFFNLTLHSVGVPGLDFIFAFAPVGIIITLFMAAGVTNAFNLIDGVNGLCGFVTISTACALAFLANKLGLPQLETMLLIIASVVFGFFAANYPFGRIFLGDAGAYLLGHTLCWIAIAVLTLRPDISPFAILLIFFWPVADTLLAIWRRKFNRTATDQPDRLHFHQLVMRYLEIRFLGRRRRKLSNPLTVIVLAPMIVSPQIIGLIFADNNQMAMIATAGFAILFIIAYLAGVHSGKNMGKKLPLYSRITPGMAAE